MKQSFAAIILGGTGQVGGAAVAELLATSDCREVVMVTRKPIAPRSRVRNVVQDTGAANFSEHTAALARGVLSQGPVSAVSCVGVGSVRRLNVGDDADRVKRSPLENGTSVCATASGAYLT